MNKNDDGRFRGGFVRDKGNGIKPVMTKPEDLARPAPELTLDASLALEGTRTFPNVKSPLKARKTKLAVMGISSAILGAGDPRYAACVHLANAYRKKRTKELFEAYGYVSSGVSALLASASLALAGARFLYEAAAGAESHTMPGIIKQASALSDSSRQNELSAWELCAREATIRKRNMETSGLQPWLVTSSPDTEQTSPSGMVKRGRGRPRKDSGGTNNAG